MSAPTTPSRSGPVGTRRSKAMLVVAGLGTTIALGACSLGAVPGDTDVALAGGGYRGGGAQAGGGGGYGGDGYGGGQGGAVEDGDAPLRIADLPLGTLATEEIDGLVWLREEEKLAHDVYVALGETWGSRIFENIVRSETTHMDAIKALLDRHGIPDPAANQPAGVFTNTDLQALYDDLVARGRTSLVDALTVGALIEDLDISDLQERATDTPDIALVYESLEQGSENHLRAFARNLDRQGATYSPAYITAEEYQSIINGSWGGPGRSS